MSKTREFKDNALMLECLEMAKGSFTTTQTSEYQYVAQHRLHDRYLSFQKLDFVRISISHVRFENNAIRDGGLTITGVRELGAGKQHNIPLYLKILTLFTCYYVTEPKQRQIR